MFIPVEPASFTARLIGSEEVPAVRTSARGTLSMRITDRGLWYELTAFNLSSPIVGAHFHLGRDGENGPMVEEIAIRGEDQMVQTFWTDVSTEEWDALTDDGIYVNIHTVNYPDGEIRGQVDFRR